MAKNATAILLYDDKKRILLQHRDKKAKRCPLFWTFFGGGIKKGETPKEAAKRELREELDYDSKNPVLMIEIDIKEKNTYKTKYVFAEKIDHMQKITLLEGQDWGWFLPSETSGLKMTNHDREILKRIENKY